MRYSRFLIILLILFNENRAHEKSDALRPSNIAFLLTGFATVAATSFEAGRVIYHAYARDRKAIPSALGSDTKSFACGWAATASVLVLSIVHPKVLAPLLKATTYLPLIIAGKLCTRVSDSYFTAQEATIFGISCVGSFLLNWHIMKRSAEWYIHKRGVIAQPEIAAAQKQEVALPPTPENLQTEALFSVALENQARTWYTKLDPKNQEACPICHEPIQPDTLHITRCEQPKAYAVHYYHTECINDWKKKGHTGCPTCRGTMLGFRMATTFSSGTLLWIKNTFN